MERPLSETGCKEGVTPTAAYPWRTSSCTCWSVLPVVLTVNGLGPGPGAPATVNCTSPWWPLGLTRISTRFSRSGPCELPAVVLTWKPASLVAALPGTTLNEMELTFWLKSICFAPFVHVISGEGKAQPPVQVHVAAIVALQRLVAALSATVAPGSPAVSGAVATIGVPSPVTWSLTSSAVAEQPIQGESTLHGGAGQVPSFEKCSEAPPGGAARTRVGWTATTSTKAASRRPFGILIIGISSHTESRRAPREASGEECGLGHTRRCQGCPIVVRNLGRSRAVPGSFVDSHEVPESVVGGR